MSAAPKGRIAQCFADLARQKRAGLVTYLMAGDPDAETYEALLAGLPEAGADIVEVGMPFSDPMADGPSIQAAGLRALKSGTKLAGVLAMIGRFRQRDQTTPIVLMGYFNPIYRYGVDRFVADAVAAGIDGLIVVDLPPEEDDELCVQANAGGLDFIHLATPTTDEARLGPVLERASGFIYYVSIAGITGTRSGAAVDIKGAVDRVRARTALPVAVGFGVKTPDQAAAIARVADAVVVGSRLVDQLAAQLDGAGRAKPGAVASCLDVVRDLSRGVRSARG